MNRKELLEMHTETCEAARSIMEAKNADYTGGNEGDDPFANFRATEMLGIPAELGVLTRCLDKFQRIKSFVKNGTLQVKSESVEDAIQDVINYMILLKGIISERQEVKEDSPTKTINEWRILHPEWFECVAGPEPPQEVKDEIYKAEGFVKPCCDSAGAGKWCECEKTP
jgi:hypothetical protein